MVKIIKVFQKQITKITPKMPQPKAHTTRTRNVMFIAHPLQYCKKCGAKLRITVLQGRLFCKPCFEYKDKRWGF